MTESATRRDHHDWASDTYVEEWVRRQQADDPTRADRFELMCDLFPFSRDAKATILDVGTGYAPLSAFILDRFPHATCVGQDNSEPMLNRARKLMGKYGARFNAHHADLFDKKWLPAQWAPFDAAVSSICLHNLRDFRRIGEIYGEVRAQLKPGGVFLILDLVNAPTPELEQRYGIVAAARRERAERLRDGVETMVRHVEAPPAPGTRGHFPASLDEHLRSLSTAGFTNVDCFWKDLRHALYGGYA